MFIIADPDFRVFIVFSLNQNNQVIKYGSVENISVQLATSRGNPTYIMIKEFLNDYELLSLKKLSATSWVATHEKLFTRPLMTQCINVLK